MVILQESRTLFLSRNLEPDIRVVDAHSSVGGKLATRWILLCCTHLLEFIIFIKLLHLLPRVGCSATQRLLGFLEYGTHCRSFDDV
jgi:hypothetical protein